MVCLPASDRVYIRTTYNTFRPQRCCHFAHRFVSTSGTYIRVISIYKPLECPATIYDVSVYLSDAFYTLSNMYIYLQMRARRLITRRKSLNIHLISTRFCARRNSVFIFTTHFTIKTVQSESNGVYIWQRTIYRKTLQHSPFL